MPAASFFYAGDAVCGSALLCLPHRLGGVPLSAGAVFGVCGRERSECGARAAEDGVDGKSEIHALGEWTAGQGDGDGYVGIPHGGDGDLYGIGRRGRVQADGAGHVHK